MTTQILTNDICSEEWKYKIEHSDEEWLIRQYLGLDMIITLMEKNISKKFHGLKCKVGSVSEDIYRDEIFPLENEKMTVEIQFVDVEDELEKRGIDILGYGDVV